MYKGFGVIELLISFLLLSIIIAGFMNMTLIQMKESGQIQSAPIEEVQNQADEMINEIEDIRQKNLQYEEDLLNSN